MRQIQTTIDNGSENIICDIWTEGKAATFSVQCFRITRFQMLHSKLWLQLSRKEEQMSKGRQKSGHQQASRHNRSTNEVLMEDTHYIFVKIDVRRNLEENTVCSRLAVHSD